jgi:hypothetical protein
MGKTFRVQKSFEQEFGASNTWHASLILIEACVCCTVDNVYRIVRVSQICDEPVTEIS